MQEELGAMRTAAAQHVAENIALQARVVELSTAVGRLRQSEGQMEEERERLQTACRAAREVTDR